MNTKRTRLSLASLATALFTALPPAMAQTAPATGPVAPASPAANGSELPLIDAEVRKVDPAAGKITLKHAEISNLDMPPMTMVFQVKNRAMLDTVKAGDMVRFRADKLLGAYVAVEILPKR